MNSRSNISIVVLGLFVAVALFFLLGRGVLSRTNLGQTYVSDTYGISFSYPSTYVLSESDPNTSGGPAHHAILIVSKENEYVPKYSDAPPSITVDFYENDFSNRQLENWIRGSRVSNFVRSVDGILYSATVAGTQAYRYRWDGLHRADTYAFASRDNVVLFTVTFNSPDDQIHHDFDAIIGSIRLY